MVIYRGTERITTGVASGRVKHYKKIYGRVKSNRFKRITKRNETKGKAIETVKQIRRQIKFAERG